VAISRSKTWLSGEVLAAADLNQGFDEIVEGGVNLVSPWTANMAADGFDLTGLDELAFDDAATGASAAGRLRRNGTALEWHNGTSSRPITGFGARVYNNANISITNSLATTLTFNSERYDNAAFHDTGSNTSRLTAPVSGKYLIAAHVRFAADIDYTSLSVFILLNGATTIASQVDALAFNSNVIDRSVVTVHALDAGDYVEVVVLQVNSSAGNNNVVSQANVSPEFCIQYMGN
jgi:hypothetical protein